jgi:hypothetical protein
MNGFRMRHIALMLGAALLLAAIFAPWMTITAFYYPLRPTTWAWSPFDILWNALVSAFPNAPEVNAWFINRASMLVICSAFYLGAAVTIAGFALPLIRNDMRQASAARAIWPPLVSAVLAGFMTLLIWGVVPFLYEIADGSNVEVRPFEGPDSIGIALAIAGAALAFVALLGITIAAHDRRRRLTPPLTGH